MIILYIIRSSDMFIKNGHSVKRMGSNIRQQYNLYALIFEYIILYYTWA